MDTKLELGEIQLISFAQPPLVPGDYEIDVTQTVKYENELPEPLNTTKSFSVRGLDGLTLPPNSILSIYPAEGESIEYRILPHIVFQDPYLPWEFEANQEEASGPLGNLQIPWLALLVFEEDMLGTASLTDPAVKPSSTRSTTLTKKQIAELREKKVRFPFAESSLPDPNSTLDIVVVNSKGFNAYFGPQSLAEDRKGKAQSWIQRYNYYAHVRRTVSRADKPADVFSVVMGHHIGPIDTSEPTTAYAHLVSLAGIQQNLTYPAQPQELTALVSLRSWTYKCLPRTENVGKGNDLGTVMLRLSDNIRPMTRLEPPTLSDQEDSKWLQNRGKNGYTFVHHRLPSGESSPALYRGPLIPNRPRPDERLNVESDVHGAGLSKVDANTGFLDISYSVAWELGRSVGIDNASFYASLSQLRAKLSSIWTEAATATQFPIAIPENTQSTNLPSWLSGIRLAVDLIPEKEPETPAQPVAIAPRWKAGQEKKNAGQRDTAPLKYDNSTGLAAIQEGLKKSMELLIDSERIKDRPMDGNIIPPLERFVKYINEVAMPSEGSAVFTFNATVKNNIQLLTERAKSKDLSIPNDNNGPIPVLTRVIAYISSDMDSDHSATLGSIREELNKSLKLLVDRNNSLDFIFNNNSLVPFLAKVVAYIEKEILSLRSIPRNHMFPEPDILETDAVLTFYIDRNWLDAMIDGLLSIGNHGSLGDFLKNEIKIAINSYLNFIDDAKTIRAHRLPAWGFVLCGQILRNFPDVQIRLTKEPQPVPPAHLVRSTTIQSDSQLFLFDCLPELLSEGLYILQPPHLQRFIGVTEASIEQKSAEDKTKIEKYKFELRAAPTQATVKQNPVAKIADMISDSTSPLLKDHCLDPFMLLQHYVREAPKSTKFESKGSSADLAFTLGDPLLELIVVPAQDQNPQKVPLPPFNLYFQESKLDSEIADEDMRSVPRARRKITLDASSGTLPLQAKRRAAAKAQRTGPTLDATDPERERITALRPSPARPIERKARSQGQANRESVLTKACRILSTTPNGSFSSADLLISIVSRDSADASSNLFLTSLELHLAPTELIQSRDTLPVVRMVGSSCNGWAVSTTVVNQEEDQSCRALVVQLKAALIASVADLDLSFVLCGVQIPARTGVHALAFDFHEGYWQSDEAGGTPSDLRGRFSAELSL